MEKFPFYCIYCEKQSYTLNNADIIQIWIELLHHDYILKRINNIPKCLTWVYKYGHSLDLPRALHV